MKFKYKVSTILLFAAALTFSSCENAIEVNPKQSIELSSALNSRQNINAAITGAYARLKSARVYGRDMIAFPEALADNGRFTNKSGRFANETRNIHGAHFNNWQNYYYMINDINLTLDAIPNLDVIPAITDAERNAWIGQLKFLRAIAYFDLTRVYAYDPMVAVALNDKGGVPIVLTGIKTLEDAVLLLPKRAKVEEVYAQIYNDLTDAEAKLGDLAVSPALATKQAAQALFARVALYNKDYTRAATYADKVIASHGSRLMTTSNYVSGWRNKVNPESLFEVTYTINSENIGVNESLQTSFTNLVVAGNRNQFSGFGDLVPSVSLLADLGITVTGNNSSTAAITARSTDVRNQLYELSAFGRGAINVETTKYLGKNGFINLDNAIVLRVSEMYLIKAEAYSAIGSTILDESVAREALIMIKKNRYTTYAGSTMEASDLLLSGAALRNEILKQRRIEFAFEGHRFFDLKRQGMDMIKAPTYTNLPYSDYKVLPSLPTREVDGNKDLSNNTGY